MLDALSQETELMPLPPPAERELVHVRTVECRGYRRGDGLWDIEGHITDTKSYPVENAWRGTIQPGGPIHDMWIRVTIDDDMAIRDATAATEAAPFSVCGDIAPAFRKLVGLRIGPGWRRRVQERLGGVQGCTHLVELLGPLATTAFQTFAARRREQEGSQTEEDAPRPPRLLNSCHAFRSDGPVVRRLWPRHYTGPDAPDASGAGARPLVAR